MRESRSRNAFTLVELMVVIAIMGILAAILFPALTTARAKAYDPDCQNNLKQLGAALYQYATTQPTGKFPPSAFMGPTNMTALIDDMIDYIPPDSPSWMCKRYAKLNGLDIKAAIGAKSIGYFYWANSIGPTDTEAKNAWSTGSFTNVGVVIMSDVFAPYPYASTGPFVQYHAGASTDIKLNQPGTHVLLLSGGVKKVAPHS